MMESRKDEKKTYQLTRSIPVEEGYDIVVAGGGPAGSAAAICAARLGARVLLAEATGCLGGMGTSGMVAAFGPMANGERSLVGGFPRELMEKMYSRGFLPPDVKPKNWRKDYHHWVRFNPEGLKLLLDELATDAGVEVRFYTKVIDAEADRENRKVEGVILHNVEGYSYVPARAFVDATGDAVLADLCGAHCREAGRDAPNLMPSTMCSAQSSIDFSNLGNQQEAVLKAIEDGFFSQPDRHVPGLFRSGRTTASLNAGHVFEMNALSCGSLSEGMIRGRKLVWEYVDFYRKYVAGCQNMEFVTTAALMGVRDSRRIVGEYKLNITDDFLARRQFPDQIGVLNRFADVHVHDSSEEEYERFSHRLKEMRLGVGECFGIPYGVIVPRGWSNLWAPGRCASSDDLVHGSIRAQPPSSMMGQAAGTAAVQSIRTGQPACDLDTEELVISLRNAEAYLPQETLSTTMTRSAKQ
ncbi:FAD-dependent oxidoreductase [Candidatus Poribacteria bacterium]